MSETPAINYSYFYSDQLDGKGLETGAKEIGDLQPQVGELAPSKLAFLFKERGDGCSYKTGTKISEPALQILYECVSQISHVLPQVWLAARLCLVTGGTKRTQISPNEGS